MYLRISFRLGEEDRLSLMRKRIVFSTARKDGASILCMLSREGESHAEEQNRSQSSPTRRERAIYS